MISVIIPLYNKELHIGRALKSVLNQTFANYEIIVVDDGSTDQGASLVRNFKDPRIQLISQINMGVSAARNRGIETASGKLIAFLDADDEWCPLFLETVQNLHEQHPDAGMYATSYHIVAPNGKTRSPRFHGIPCPPWEGILNSYFRSAALGEPPVSASSVCIPSEVFTKVGKFLIGKRMGEDLEMWGRIAMRYNVAFSTRCQAIYYQNATNRACSQFYENDIHPFITTGLASDYNRDLHMRNDIFLYISKLIVENARQYVLAGKYATGRNLLKYYKVTSFPCRRFLWGSRFNLITKRIWEIKQLMVNLFC